MGNNEESSIFEQLEILALYHHLYPDEASFVRKLQRWFSSTFHTPINIVEEMPIELLLLHHYEYRLETMDAKDLEKHKKRLLNPEILKQEEQEDDKFVEELEMKIIKDKKKELLKNVQDATHKVVKALENKEIEIPPDISLKF